ncbi:MAG TPA: hypothetical protein VK335_08560 [Bryobacteraceae bacterium]|nr:hypothetical protein [Bryobacteraceae bacterium]HXR15960.1 hypothetical protein [Terriglobales bacterium]HZW96168.1 hypothetical protein [Candidatus Eremiobacteraceae bacterium]
MEFRAEKRAIAFIGGLLLLQAMFAQQSFQYEAWHGHSRPPHIRKAGGLGTLTISDTGVSFQEKYRDAKTPKHPHAWHWDYQDIQQLKISPKTVTVLTYKDNKWKLGADREYEFDLVSDDSFENVYQVLKARLDQRFVAVIADRPATVLWEIPAKHLTGFGGDEGVLQVSANEIVYKSAKKGESRTWRYEDIDNVSSSGPFAFTITTFERARLDYGSRKQFNFELKQRLEEARYDDLWLRLNRSKGLQILTSYREAGADGK